jgi:hypothetical protein
MTGQTSERAFEAYVEEILLTRCGWKSGSNAAVERLRNAAPPSSPPPSPASLTSA